MRITGTLEAKRAGHKSGWRLLRAGLVVLAVTLVDSWSARDAHGQLAADAGAVGSPLQGAADALERRVTALGGALSLHVVEVQSGSVVAAIHASEPQNPASNAKLLTAAVVLRRLGSNRRFLTGLYGSVRGDTIPTLVLRGQGDPSLSMADLAGLARELRDLGVRRVGKLLVDQSYFDEHFVPPAFEQQPEEWAPFRAPTAALSLDRNTLTFTVVPKELGRAPAVTASVPAFVDVRVEATTSTKAEAETLSIALAPNDGRLTARLSGTVPLRSGARRIVRRVDDPRLFGGYALRESLRELGLEVPEQVGLGGKGEKALLASHASPPVGELLPALGKHSDNFVAEMLFKHLGSGPDGAPADVATAARVLEEDLRALGVFREGTVVRNGSGLFDAERVSAEALTALLRAMYRGPFAAEFTQHLAVGGVDGTLRGRFRTWSDRRAIRAKTGTLRSVGALSGYVFGPEGTSPLAFSVLVNGVPDKVGAAREATDAFVEELAKARWSPPRDRPTP